MNTVETKQKELPVIPPHPICGSYYVKPIDVSKQNGMYLFFKRVFDVVISVLLLIIMAVPMLLIAIIVPMDSPGPVFFRQERLGLNGKPFMILKFRSMYVDAEKNGAQWSDGEADVRITRVGRFLRKSRLDELPQLFQTLSGTMSLIGPRPERKVFYDLFETYIHGFSERLKVKPGITGWAQVCGGYYLCPEEKVEYDVEYIEKRSVAMDIDILLKTVRIVFTHEGAK